MTSTRSVRARLTVVMAMLVATLVSGASLWAQASKVMPVTAETIVYVTKTGKKYHQVECRTLRASRIPMKLGEASKVFGACAVCKPPLLPLASAAAAATPPATTPSTRSSAPPAPPTASRQCAATTKKGTRCSRTAKAGSAYCWQHGG